MNAYILTWNPTRSAWPELLERIDQLNSAGYSRQRWSCGSTRRIKKGDRLFFMRLGSKPRGIMASGYAASSFYEAPHWSGEPGKVARYIDIDFDILLKPDSQPIFERSYLEEVDPDKHQHWFPESSGISIKQSVISELESKWFEFCTSHQYMSSSFFSSDSKDADQVILYEGTPIDIIQTKYERNPAARKRCLEYHGYSCMVCKINFEKTYGEIGKGFIHVHHIHQLADKGYEHKVNPVEDLVPVCPNCHAMIHAKRPAYTIDEMRNLIIQN